MGRCDGPRAPMLPNTRRIIEEFYSPYNAELAELLGDDSYAWGITDAPVDQ